MESRVIRSSMKNYLQRCDVPWDQMAIHLPSNYPVTTTRRSMDLIAVLMENLVNGLCGDFSNKVNFFVIILSTLRRRWTGRSEWSTQLDHIEWDHEHLNWINFVILYIDPHIYSDQICSMCYSLMAFQCSFVQTSKHFFSFGMKLHTANKRCNVTFIMSITSHNI